jgi:hypothetical protein
LHLALGELHEHTGDLFTDQLPDRNDRRFTRLTSKEAAQKAYDQVVRTAWRELYLLIKAKLVAVESKHITIKDEFLAYTVMPDGRTVSGSSHNLKTPTRLARCRRSCWAQRRARLGLCSSDIINLATPTAI